MKALAVVLLLAVTAAGSSGCAPKSTEPAPPQSVYQDPNNRDYSEKHILLSDGRTVTCLEWMSGGSGTASIRGGISCDWTGAEGTK